MPDTTDALLALQTRLLAELLKDNQTTAARLLRLYSAVFDRLSTDWLSLLTRIEAERSKAGIPTPAFDVLVLQQERIRRLRLQTAAQITRFAREAERLVKADQLTAVDVGRIHAGRMMGEALTVTAPGVEVSFSQLPKRALETLVGHFSNGEPIRALFDELGPQAAAKAESVLFEAVATGRSPLVAARELRSALSMPLTRSLMISRTEMLGAYRAANLATFSENADVVKGWRWNAHLGASTCSACIALHGTFHPLSETFMHAHVSCRCSPTPETKTFAELGIDVPERRQRLRTGPDWFQDQSIATQERILGPRKLDLYRDGAIDLEDLVFEDFNPRWGASFREGSINAALAVHGTPKWWQRYD